MALTHKERRDRDIYEYVTALFSKKLNGKTMYTSAYVLERASEKFYLTPDTIADIVRAYVPPIDDLAQLDIFNPPETLATQGHSTAQ